jgi:hypothetical protein
MRTSGPDIVMGNGSQFEVLYSDVMTLQGEGLIEVTQYHSTGSGFGFFVTPLGFEFYEELKKQTAEPVEQVEETTLRYLDSGEFQNRHPQSFSQWKEAADLLWGADSETALSTIGHKCREAVQSFVTELLELHGISDAPPDVARTRDRLSAVLKRQHPNIGERHRELLDSLFSYRVAACDLAQRQEHGGQKAEPLGWEDGRRVVFQTAVVMFEIHRTTER